VEYVPFRAGSVIRCCLEFAVGGWSGRSGRRRRMGQIALGCLCEHPQVITVGRGGSPAEDRRPKDRFDCRTGQIDGPWVQPWRRVYGPLPRPIGHPTRSPPCPWHGFSVGEVSSNVYRAGIVETLDDLGIRSHTRPGRHGVWGRTGQLAAVAISVRGWVTYYGAYLNVCPPMGLFRLVETDPEDHTRMSCLVAERRGAARMTTVRAALVRHLAEAFGCDRYHLYTGHPLLQRKSRRRAGDG